MDRIVRPSFGDVPGREYALQLFAEHLIHAWDLARATGADERLDTGLVASCATWFDAVEGAYRGAGAIAARPPVSGDADAQCSGLAPYLVHMACIPAPPGGSVLNQQEQRPPPASR